MKKIFFPAACVIFFSSDCPAQLNVSYISSNQFVQQWAGSNVSFSNVVFSGVDPSQVASFSGATVPNIGIPDGVMLATGDAMIAADTTTNFTNGNALGGGGDADLSGACNQQTRDLAAIEFDFWTPADSVEFKFLFASEEYNYWVNSKNDVCGARLYNAGGGYANIIYLPGTSTPVCVNSVNNGSVPNIGDPSTGPCTNCQYFFDNTYGSTFKYNGYTSVFTIRMPVTPCDTFHFWIGVADAQDYIYDSAILLPSGSFKGTGTPSITAVGYPAGTDTVNICAGSPVQLSATTSASYNWSNGMTSQLITVNTPGVYYLVSACGILSNVIVVQNTGSPQSAFISSTEICPGSCIDFINQSLNATSYQWNFPGALVDTSTAANPQQVCYPDSGHFDVTLISSNGTCNDTLTLQNFIHVFAPTLPQSIYQSGDTLISNSGFVSYQWYLNGNLIAGATQSFYVAVQSGNYNVISTDSNGCEVEAVIYDVPASTGSILFETGWMLYPNPASDKITIAAKHHPAKVEAVMIYDVLGECVQQVKIPDSFHSSFVELDISSLFEGAYYVEAFSNEGCRRFKFVKDSN